MNDRIACLGWGSLIWHQDGLPVGSNPTWRQDGPELPIEFARVSQDERVTLVVVKGRAPLRVLWCELQVRGMEQAVGALKKREGNVRDEHIGRWQRGMTATEAIEQSVSVWAQHQGLAAVVWTALPPRRPGKKEGVPSVAEVLDHLGALPEEKKEAARKYICKAPEQIRTAYRIEIERQLGWTRESFTRCR